MSTFPLDIVTPEGSLFSGQAEALRLRTTEGYVSIRAGHTDYIAALDIGRVDVTREGQTRAAACGGGFLSVEKGAVRLVATTFEYADAIDAERAALARQSAEAQMAEAREARDLELAKAKLARALNRLQIAKYK